jgi:hypothetical protein
MKRAGWVTIFILAVVMGSRTSAVLADGIPPSSKSKKIIATPTPAPDEYISFESESLQQLKCNDNDTKAAELAEAAKEKTESGICPDCEAAQKAGLQAVLQLPRLLEQNNADEMKKDEEAVGQWGYGSYYSEDSTAYLAEQKKIQQKDLQRLNACLDGKFYVKFPGIAEELYDLNIYRSDLIDQLPPSDAKRIRRAHVESIVRVMNSGLSKIAPYKGKVYRGASNLPQALVDAHQKGAIIQFTSYLSTSARREGSFLGESRYEIISKTGRLVAPISPHNHETEVLFAPNTKFKVVNVEHEEGKSLYQFYLEEL